MRSVAACCALALLVAATAQAAAAATRPAAASVTLSSSRTGARDVRLTLQLRYEMQCGHPGAGPLVITFPSAERLPSQLAAGSVLVDGRPATRAERSARIVSVALPVEHGPLCDVIAPGTLKVVFTPGAGIGNPTVAGTYSLTAHTPRVSGRASMTIH